jgi:hypothetical protein
MGATQSKNKAACTQNYTDQHHVYMNVDVEGSSHGLFQGAILGFCRARLRKATKSLIMIAGIQTEIRSLNLLNMKQGS